MKNIIFVLILLMIAFNAGRVVEHYQFVVLLTEERDISLKDFKNNCLK